MSPLHPDGASVQCGRNGRVLHLDGIAAPPPLDNCKSWDLMCRPDPGTVARDRLADLTRGLPVECHAVAPGSVACRAGGRDLACAMVADGAATSLGTLRNCPPPPPRAPLVHRDNIPPAWAILAFLGAVNIVAVLAVAFDNYRRRRGFAAIADRLLLLLALIGAGGGVLAAQFALAGRDEERQLSGMVAVILGLQIGAAIGLVLL